MDPMKLAGKGNGDPMSFVDMPGFKKEEPRKLQADYFATARDYVSFIEKNPHIEIINIVSNNGMIILTYKEPS